MTSKVGAAAVIGSGSWGTVDSYCSRPGGRPRPAPRPVSPRAIALFGLVLGVSVLVAFTLNRKIFTDVFWQLTAGQWMLAHHSVIGLDPFSYTETHRRWVNDEWGSEVVLASLYKVFGAAAFNIIAIVTGSLCLVCTMLYARALGARGGRLASISILLAFAIEFESDSGMSLAISANVLRVVGEEGVPVRDLSRLVGVSKEAVAVSLGRLVERGFAVVQAASRGRVKTVRLS